MEGLLNRVETGLFGILSPYLFTTSPFSLKGIGEMGKVAEQAKVYLQEVGLQLPEQEAIRVENARKQLGFIYPSPEVVDVFAENYLRDKGLRIIETPFNVIQVSAGLTIISSLFTPQGIDKYSELGEMLEGLNGVDIPPLVQTKEDLRRVRFYPAADQNQNTEKISKNVDVITFASWYVAMTEIGLPQPAGVFDLFALVSSALTGVSKSGSLRWRELKSLLPEQINLHEYYNPDVSFNDLRENPFIILSYLNIHPQSTAVVSKKPNLLEKLFGKMW